MNVYVVTSKWDGDTWVEGVFDTKAKADAATAKIESNPNNDIEFAEIHKVTLNKETTG